MVKVRLLLAAAAVAFCLRGIRAETEPPMGAWVYQMKEDPTLPFFLNDRRATGFYSLALDEDRGIATVLYRDGDNFLSADVDMKVRGQQLTLINGKRRKSYIWDRQTLPSGEKRNIVYPVEYPPAKAGWRHGPSYAYRFVRSGDELGLRMATGEAKMDFDRQVERCVNLQDDCGPAGLGEWDVAAATAAPSVSRAPAASPPKPAAERAAFSIALVDAKLTEPEFLSTYKDEINTVLPPVIRDLTVITTYYRTSPVPYPGMADPMIQQRGLRIGIIGKKYMPNDSALPIAIEIEPLTADFQASSPNHCGTWMSDPTKNFFDVRGHPAMYAPSPLSASSSVGSSIVVCADGYSLAMETAMVRPKDYFLGLFELLPLDDIDRLAGVHAR